MDQVHVVRVDHALHFDVSGEGAFGTLQRQEVEVFRQRTELLEARRRTQQEIFVGRVQPPQRAHHVANVGGEAELVEPSNVECDAH